MFESKISKHSKNILVIAQLGQCLPIDIQIDTLLDEWKIIKVGFNDELQVGRVDSFWSNYITAKVDNGDLKYPNFAKFLQSSLSMYHGSAEIERGFSISNNILSEDRTSMKERMLNARLNIIDALKHYSYQPALVPITNKMIQKANIAYRSYNSYLENEKKIKEEKEKVELELLKAAEEEESRKKEAEKKQDRNC